VRSGEQHGRLDPRSADRQGSRAVAELLKDRGVSTRVVTTTEQAVTATGPDTTLLVAEPDLLTDAQQSALRAAMDTAGSRTVLLSADSPSVTALAPGVQAEPVGEVTARRPGCELPAATRAGAAETGHLGYRTDAPGADTCYFSDGHPTLVRVPAANGGNTVLLGAPDPLYNHRLDKQGNASLTLQLLGSRPHLVWYLPSLTDAIGDEDSGDESFADLIPSGWYWALLQLTVAALLTVVWRARRLGPLVTDPLPVVVRASESAEGRARLYYKADARDRAGAVLRSGARTRIAPLVGVPPAHAHSPEALVPSVSAQLGDPARDFHTLFFGPAPSDDAELVRLADQLDALEREVRTS
jgi:hypothetical protein